MGSIAENVISMEVTQLPKSLNDGSAQDQQKARLHQLAIAAMSERGSPIVKNMCIFLYDNYATAFQCVVNEWNRRENRDYFLQLELHHVPPVAVIPNGLGQSDWVSRQENATHCICIGGETPMRLRAGFSPRFDCTLDSRGRTVSERVRIHILLLSQHDQKIVQEWEISSDHPNHYKILEQSGVTFSDQVGYDRGNSKKRGTVSALATNTPKEPPTSKQRTAERLKSKDGRQERVSKETLEQTEAIGGRNLDCSSDFVLASSFGMGSRSMKSRTIVPTPVRTSEEGNAEGFSLGNRVTKKDEDVRYQSLGEIGELLESASNKGQPCLVNLYAVVLGFGIPSMTKRNDWMISLTLVDESLDTSPLRVVQLMSFQNDKARLPNVRYCGDVVRIHRVKAQIHKEDLQLLGLKGTSYLVFRKNLKQEESFLHSPNKTICSYSTNDKDRFPQLWDWGQQRIFNHPTIKPQNRRTLGEAQNIEASNGEECGLDLTVMVTGIFGRPPDVSDSHYPKGFLRVWDGTGTPVYDPCPTLESKQSMAETGDPPPAAISLLYRLVRQLRNEQNSHFLCPPKAVTGRVANVAVWEKMHWDFVNRFVERGSFLRLRNIQLGSATSDLPLCLNAHVKSYLTPLPDMTFEVIGLIKDHNARILRGEPMNPRSGVLPLGMDGSDVDLEASQVTQLLSELVSLPCPAMFKGEIHIVDTIPSMTTNSVTKLYEIFRLQGAIGLIVQGSDLGTMDVMVGLGVAGTTSIAQLLKVEAAGGLDMSKAIELRLPWNAKIICIVLDGTKFLVLDYLEASVSE